jgi:hypothetical protein
MGGPAGWFQQPANGSLKRWKNFPQNAFRVFSWAKITAVFWIFAVLRSIWSGGTELQTVVCQGRVFEMPCGSLPAAKGWSKAVVLRP